jgi:hypothetical protein
MLARSRDLSRLVENDGCDDLVLSLYYLPSSLGTSLHPPGNDVVQAYQRFEATTGTANTTRRRIVRGDTS